MRVAAFFAGCGGLDLGFRNAGFEIAYANDIDPAVWETYEKNHKLVVDKRSITEVPSDEVPDVIGIIGGPPCQSWSLAGAMRGIEDPRGKLFYEYARILQDKRPLFFLAENVPGLISSAHIDEFKKIINKLSDIGYNISYKLLDARNYGVPQERKRVIIVGYRKDLKKKFEFPLPTHSDTQVSRIDGKKLQKWVNLSEAIGNMPPAVPALPKNKANIYTQVPNHEYMTGGFSTMYLSRNRRKEWDNQSFTIQAGGRHAPLHPSSSKMQKISKDKWVFDDADDVRRMSVRECARIQTFPDDFIFQYKNVSDGYKMIGNAVPVKLAQAIASRIMEDLSFSKAVKIEHKTSRKAKQ